MPIGKEILVKYEAGNPKNATVVEEFDGEILYIVGAFLIIIGILACFAF